MKDYYTAAEAADLLGLTAGTIRKTLGAADQTMVIRTGHDTMVWSHEKVMALKEARKNKKPRKQIEKAEPILPDYKPGKGEALAFDVDMKTGQVIPPKLKFRGRTCRELGCNTPVPTGKLYCDVHSVLFKQMKKNVRTHIDNYTCHI